jgi:hypothetical protein
VFDLDETIVFSNIAEMFESRLNKIVLDLGNYELDAAKESAMSDQFDQIFKDKQLLVDFNETCTITINSNDPVTIYFFPQKK